MQSLPSTSPSADFLASEFCLHKELPAFLQRRREQGIPVLFVLADYCSREEIEAIERKQMPAIGTLEDMLTRLPGQTSRLFGREAELARLDAGLGAGHAGVLLWVAPGGVGKSALTRWWVERRDWQPGTRFIGHSFYSQGSRNQITSARGFLLEALLLLDGLEPLQEGIHRPRARRQAAGCGPDRGPGAGPGPGAVPGQLPPAADAAPRPIRWIRLAYPGGGAAKTGCRGGETGQVFRTDQATSHLEHSKIGPVACEQGRCGEGERTDGGLLQPPALVEPLRYRGIHRHHV